MKTQGLSSLVVLLLLPLGAGARHVPPLQSPPLAPRDSAFHVLNRLAYGPRPGEVDRVAAEGVTRWIDRQLSPRDIEDDALARREREFRILEYDRGDLAGMYAEMQRERRERLQKGDTAGTKADAAPLAQRGRHLAQQFEQLALVRATLSERQLYEIMVDFWLNHFNVYAAKGADRFLTPDYVEHVIRPRAMGTFADLLIATAK